MVTSMRPGPKLEDWNRRLHFYLGLYFLLFLWVFAVSGLFLNHDWEFTHFWEDRRESSVDRPIRIASNGDKGQTAMDVMSQLGLVGEIEWPSPTMSENQLTFRVVKPGETSDVVADLAAGTAHVKKIRVNGWGAARVLHTFSGVRINDPSFRRDWVITKIWSFAMDALAAGLLVMVLSGYYMWFRLKSKRLMGMAALIAGYVVCGFFIFGLRWI
jgi:hypothetical protein